MAGGNMKWGVEVEGRKELLRALKLFDPGEPTPHYEQSLAEAGKLLDSAASGKVPGGVGARVRYMGTRGKGTSARALVRSEHPAGRSFEFGRQMYGQPPHRVAGGFQRRPFFGVIKEDGAIAEVAPRVASILADGLEREWAAFTARGPQ
jgi:hypothetical protein